MDAAELLDGIDGRREEGSKEGLEGTPRTDEARSGLLFFSSSWVLVVRDE